MEKIWVKEEGGVSIKLLYNPSNDIDLDDLRSIFCNQFKKNALDYEIIVNDVVVIPNTAIKDIFASNSATAPVIFKLIKKQAGKIAKIKNWLLLQGARYVPWTRILYFL